MFTPAPKRVIINLPSNPSLNGAEGLLIGDKPSTFVNVLVTSGPEIGRRYQFSSAQITMPTLADTQ